MSRRLTTEELHALRQWSLLGQRSHPRRERVKALDWKTKAFLAPVTTTWNVTIRHDDLNKLLLGFQPVEMEDRWFLYAEGPDPQGNAALHMFRSWTGFPMAKLHINVPMGKDGGMVEADAVITKLTWESSDDRYKSQSEEGAKSMARGICSFILDVEIP